MKAFVARRAETRRLMALGQSYDDALLASIEVTEVHEEWVVDTLCCVEICVFEGDLYGITPAAILGPGFQEKL